jgi:hypothetical protein
MGDIRARNQQMQTAALQQQALQMENQQRQMDLQDSQLMRKAWMQSNGDLDKTSQAFAQMGGSPKGMMALQQQVMQMKEQKAKLSSAELDTQSKKNDLIEGLLQPVLNEPDPAKQEPLWNDALNTAVQKGLISADEVAQHPYQGPDGVKQYAQGLQTDKWLTANAAKDRASAQQQEANVAVDKDKRVAATENLHNAVAILGATPPASDAEFQQRVRKLDPTTAATIFGAIPPGQYDPQKSPETLRQLGMSSEQQQQAQNQKDTLAETIKRDAEAHQNHLADQSLRQLEIAISAGRLKQEQMVNGMKYGPGTTEYWAQQLQENPDSIKEMPPELRSSVGQMFRAKTGLPLPTPLSQTGQTQETAARNAIDGAMFIQKALQNPEIQKQLGPILGRLGEAEQSVGTAVGLSPEAEKLAQELRTRMRYFVFQEGKAVLGGRLPQQLMQQMEQGSANVKMDPNMLQGALNGAVGNANSILDNADKQRFGGNMRPRSMRGLPENPSSYSHTATGPNGHKIGTNDGKTWFDVQTGKQIQ